MPTAAMMFKQVVVGGGGAGHGFYRTLTIDHTQVGASDSTDFPILVSLTNASLATVANGGKVQNASGFDLGFFSDVGITTRLKHEMEKYVATTGEIVYWVKVPTVSHTVDTVIYMAYGDTTITTDQSDAAGTWSNSFTRVVHLGDGVSLSGTESVSGANFAITNATAAAGTIYGAGSFSTASNQYLKNTAAAVSATPMTFSAWAKLANTTFAGGEERIITTVAKTSGLDEFWLSYFNQSGSVVLRMVAQQSGAGLGIFATPTLDTNWHLLHGILAVTSKIYQDGSPLTPGVTGVPEVPAGLTDTYIGGLWFNTSNFYGPFQGLLDEVRIATVERSADWITTEYNNQKSGSTLIATGVETSY